MKERQSEAISTNIQFSIFNSGLSGLGTAPVNMQSLVAAV
jgi:hypothetical protein